MLEIKTKHGNFRTVRDLRIFMEHEQLQTVHIEASFIFDKIADLDLTLDQIRQIENS